MSHRIYGHNDKMCFFSGVGIGLLRDASYLMTDQYFKKRKDYVEVFLVAASGAGILVMTLVVHVAVRYKKYFIFTIIPNNVIIYDKRRETRLVFICLFWISGLGWRFGLQAVTVGLFSTFFLSTCYRSASLYHPQRRAIVHLKNQKRKVQ